MLFFHNCLKVVNSDWSIKRNGVNLETLKNIKFIKIGIFELNK